MPVRSVHPEPLAIVGHTDAQLRQRFLYLTASRVTVCTVIFGGTIAVYLAEAHSFDGPTPRLLLGVMSTSPSCAPMNSWGRCWYRDIACMPRLKNWRQRTT